MAKRDYYEVLEITRTASAEEIKKSYRKKALLFHPDKNQGDKGSEEKFKEATEAYSILSDADARRKYDQFGHSAFEQGGGFSGGDFSGFEDIFGDIFGAFFGGGPTSRRSSGRPGRDLKYDLEVTFVEAAFGVEKEIHFQRRQKCKECLGSGAAKGSSPENCKQCGGSGQVRFHQGFFTMSRPCSTCNGSGKVIKDPCKKCVASGLTTAGHKLNVKVPAGIDHGQRLKLRGEGEEGVQGGGNGDLYVQIAIKPHPIFERQEAEVVCEVPISYTSAVLGTEMDIPTLDGRTKLKIPAGTPSGKIFQMKGKGIPILGTNGRRGDQHVRVFVNVPKKISDEKKELLARLQELEGTEPDQESKSFIDKVKELFA